MTLLEMVISLAILLIVAVGVMGLGAVAMMTTENQGHLTARTAEYAQDKMEQLLALKYCDATSDTSVFADKCSRADKDWQVVPLHLITMEPE